MDDKDFNTILEQLKIVTKELTFQIAARWQDITIAEIEERNPVVRKAIETIQMYDEQISVFGR
jgi:hypothetical protein